MTLYSFLIYVFFSFLIVSCAVHTGNLNNVQLPQSTDGIVYKEKVFGYASCNYVFSIGGMGSQGLAAEAMLNLNNGVALKKGEYLDNLTIDHKRFYFIPFFIRHEVLLTADRIMTESEHNIDYDSTYKQGLIDFTKYPNGFDLNEKVYVYKPGEKGDRLVEEAIVVSRRYLSSKVIYTKAKKLQVKRVPNRHLYTKNANNNVNFLLSLNHGDDFLVHKKKLEKLNRLIPMDNEIQNEFQRFVFLGSNNTNILVKNLTDSKVYYLNKQFVVIKDFTREMESKLNSIMLQIIKNGDPDQELIVKKDEESHVYGKLKEVEGEEVVIRTVGQGEIRAHISEVFTIRNWLDFRNNGEPKDFMWKAGQKKRIVDIANSQGYSEFVNPKSSNVKILGFRYHNVLVMNDQSEVFEVPIGLVF